MAYKKTVAVGLSGGVDSAVTAYLLKEQGYNVLGINFKLLENSSSNTEARKVAEQLQIPFYTLDMTKIFKENVIDYFIKEYLAGRTPNPCVMCNKKIKFKEFLKRARELGANFIATGHYARIEWDNNKKNYLLKKGKDSNKDQSYFLYYLSPEILKYIIMPLGEYTKNEVREIASKINLDLAKKEESQEICFIPDNDYKGFLEKQVGNKIKKGNFINTEGEKIGTHRGLPYYTVGQRKGLGLALGKPVYVVNLDSQKNNVIIGEKEKLYQQKLISTNNNFLIPVLENKKINIEAKIRYRIKPAPATMEVNGNQANLQFTEKQRAITPGQSVVYYQDDIVVGGGIILQAY